MIFADFFSLSTFNWDTGCMEWRRYKNEDGYGRFSRKGRLYLVHRYAAYLAGILTYKELHNPDVVVMHICDNPPCVNFGHLKKGTQVENIRDRDQKGRGRKFFKRNKIGRFIK
jgi:hypothetical protein